MRRTPVHGAESRLIAPQRTTGSRSLARSVVPCRMSAVLPLRAFVMRFWQFPQHIVLVRITTAP